MSVDELSVMDGSKCILQLRGVRPFLSDKYDITKHKNYHLLSDDNTKNAFNIGKYVSTKLRVNPEEEFDMHEYSEPDEGMPDGAMDGYQSFDESVDEVDDTEYEEDYEPV